MGFLPQEDVSSIASDSPQHTPRSPDAHRSPSSHDAAGRAIHLTIDSRVDFDDAVDTMFLGKLAAESLFGIHRVLLEAGYQVDHHRRISLDVSTEVGRAFAVVYHGYLIAEFGCASVQISRSTEGL